jgi:hypothetical protein
MDIKVQNITISPNKIRAVIDSLDRAIERNTKLKELCEAILKIQRGAGGGSSGSAPRARGGKTLRESIVDVLAKSKTPLGAGALRDKVLAAGYQTRAKPHSFYTAVYNTANQGTGIVRTKDGFRLRKGGGGGGGSSKTVKTVKTVKPAKSSTRRGKKKAKSKRAQSKAIA